VQVKFDENNIKVSHRLHVTPADIQYRTWHIHDIVQHVFQMNPECKYCWNKQSCLIVCTV